MAVITDYYSKKKLMAKLADELAKLEEREDLKKELEFEEQVKALLSSANKSPRDALAILAAIDPSIMGDGSAADTKTAGSRPKRAMKKYTNPHTGEVVETRGGNHKTLKAWREQYGADAVASWAN